MIDDVRNLKDEAAALLSRGKLRGALKLYKKAGALDPMDIYARMKIGEILARLGRTEEATREYQHVVGRYAADGMFLKAVAVCKVILSLDPGHSLVQRTLAALYAEHRRLEDMEPSFLMPPSMSAAIPAEPSRSLIEFPLEPSSFLIETEGFEELLTEQVADAAEAVAELEVIDEVEDEEELPELEVIDEDEDEDEEIDEIELEEDEIIIIQESSALVDRSSIPQIPLFSSLPSDAVVTLIENLAMSWTEPGDRVVTEGEPGDTMFIVIQGNYEVVSEPLGGEPQPITRLGPGDFFGEMALVSGCPRFATVVSQDEGVLLELSQRTLDYISVGHPRVKEELRAYYLSRLLENLGVTSPLFATFPAEAQRFFVERSSVWSLEAEAVIEGQGSPSEGVWLLISGRCVVFQITTDGKELRFPDILPGDIFGVTSTLYATDSPTSVRSLRDCVLLHLTPSAFRDLLAIHPEVLMSMDNLVDQRRHRTGVRTIGLI
jgi:CRP-like cAMP-binding protein